VSFAGATHASPLSAVTAPAAPARVRLASQLALRWVRLAKTPPIADPTTSARTIRRSLQTTGNTRRRVRHRTRPTCAGLHCDRRPPEQPRAHTLRRDQIDYVPPRFDPAARALRSGVPLLLRLPTLPLGSQGAPLTVGRSERTRSAERPTAESVKRLQHAAAMLHCVRDTGTANL
jgi:hypothetical protein